MKRVVLTALAVIAASSIVLAQNQTVSGTVTDPSGAPVIGGSVFVKDTSNGAITDIDGHYSLSRVNPGNVLVFSCIGYTSQEITWQGGPLYSPLIQSSRFVNCL